MATGRSHSGNDLLGSAWSSEGDQDRLVNSTASLRAYGAYFRRLRDASTLKNSTATANTMAK
jgi:hypothetical protein